jgi:carbon-monoxide dehydrogenase medium subunit
MYPAPFEYHSPKTLAEALALLEQHGDAGKAIAGSMSLVPMMKLRLVTPAHVIDLRKLPGMVGVWETGGALQIGAMTTHRQIEHDATVRKVMPMMAEAAGNIGDRQVRNMGTIGGSLAHADPSADWPAVTIALDATLQLVSKSGERSVKAEDFIVGPLTTVLQPGELIAQVRIPAAAARTGRAYEKCPHPASRFAIAGIAAALTLDAAGKIASARVAITGVGPKASRASGVEKALLGKAPDAAAIEAAAAHATDGIEVRDDLVGSADYKKHLAKAFAIRALTRAASEAGRG